MNNKQMRDIINNHYKNTPSKIVTNDIINLYTDKENIWGVETLPDHWFSIFIILYKSFNQSTKYILNNFIDKNDISIKAFKNFVKNPLDHTLAQFLIDTGIVNNKTGNLVNTKENIPDHMPEWLRKLKIKITNNQLQSIISLFGNAYKELQSITDSIETHNTTANDSTNDFAPQESPAPSPNDHLLKADTERLSCAPLDPDILTDPLRGHWDLWPASDENTNKKLTITLENGLVARNPARDIRSNQAVCIDFGTSATVVAIRENGQKRLLRIGLTNWRAAAEARHFENPTALEFSDATEFAKAWNKEYWRPHTRWSDLKCSHQVREEMRSEYDSKKLFSIIGDIKSWLRHAGPDSRLDLRDQKDKPFSLVCTAVEPGKDDQIVLNPVEIYAFYLGLVINSQYRENGSIYHDYHLSFPCNTDPEIRERILASFRTGLERSLPESLGQQDGWRKRTPFSVRAGVDEPVGYAAGMLAALGLEPEDEPLPFAVFDFGGGTSDFAFGLYRWATDEEDEKQAWEKVLVLLDVAGSPDLGGEQLLRRMAWQIACNNLEELKQRQIAVALPHGLGKPSGSEMVFVDSLDGRANLSRLAEAMRQLWEKGPKDFAPANEGVLRISLFGNGGKAAPAGKEKSRAGKDSGLLDLKVDCAALTDMASQQIAAGITSFAMACKQAFSRLDKRPATLHVLLAGNSCRSPLFQAAGDDLQKAVCEALDLPPENIIIHYPPTSENAGPEVFGLKTGVALGMLDTVPGESTGVLRPATAAPACTVGLFRRGLLNPYLGRHTAIGEWVSLGIVRQDLTMLVGFSQDPLALEGKLPRNQCSELRHVWQPEAAEHKLSARFLDSCTIEFALDVEEKASANGRNKVIYRIDRNVATLVEE